MSVGKMLYKSREHGESTRDPKVRKLIRKRYKDRCYYCNRKYNPKLASQYPQMYFSVIEIDHRVPFYRGGKNDTTNYVLSCKECNRAKGVNVYD